MRDLLSANLLRLKKNYAFWGAMGVSFGLALATVIDVYRVAQTFGGTTSVDAELFKYAAFIGILAAELIPLFFGTEYSNGAIRNKLIVGQSRLSIYFANLITGFAACVLCSAAYMLGCMALGIPLLGWFTQPPALLFTALIGSLLMMAAFCAIFTFVTMNCAKKSTSVAICLLGTFAAFIWALVIHSMLEAPEFIQGYEMSVNGQVVNAVPEPNPNHLTGLKREVYQFLFDLLPSGQSIQYCSLVLSDPVRLMGLAAAVCVVFTGAGAALFRRKDLK